MSKNNISDELKTIEEEIKILNTELERQASVNSKLLSLISVTSIIASSLNKKEVLKSILDQTKFLMECKDSSVLLVNNEEQKLYFELLSNEEDYEALKDIRLAKGEGIAGTVWETGEPILIEEACKDERFSNKADEKLDTVTNSLIAVPLIVNEKIIGVMEAINKNGGACFNHFDLEIFKILSIQAAIAIQNAELYELAISDGMTKLFIHRYFMRRLKEEFKRSKRYFRNLSLIMFDIDHFKKFNDTYGHQLGDEVLIATAGIIKQGCRSSDIPARYGGEEFSVILPETCEKGAMDLAERIRGKIEKLEILNDGKIIKLTISAGVATLKGNKPVSAAELIKMADSALYYSKRTGRNRVSCFNTDMIKARE